ncbi:taxadiene 5-alpha hydroxylase-like [Magnolia sinica]|uniref:taxadiene 5-alpha hydroxylase-like n=1 Tax=Magnolia sinica TaxID=86752 RepID=UPI00265A22D4|nr:taxadiene 5-alpha hydroxylase-like [Magnolia sinica]
MLGFSEFFEAQASSHMILVAIALISFFFLSNLLRRRDDHRLKNLPQGSLGLPIIGESWSFLRAIKNNRGADWVNERVAKHGPVFKTSILGSSTVVLTGQAGNKFVLSTDEVALSMKQPPSSVRIVGKQNIFELNGNRYKLVKGAMMRFLKPESLQEYIGIMDDLVKTNLLMKIKEEETIKLVPLLKVLTFDVSCSLLFGIHDKPTKEALFEDFATALRGVWSIPVNFPGTVFWRALRARSRIDKRLFPIIRRRKDLLEEGIVSSRNDVISYLIALRDENQQPLTEDAIMDNIVALLMASHDTTTCLVSLVVWKLARDPRLQQNILQEHMEILGERRGAEDKLTCSEAQKMKYTWRVAQEMLRVIPILFANSRKALQDINFGGYDIPKGWQVICMASTTHLDENIFNNSMEFDPSRFQNSSKPIPPFTFIPFGGGPRMCIGIEFGRIEALTIIHHMVTNFDWLLVNPDETITYQPFPYPSMGLPIKVKPRNPSQ